MVTFFWLFGSNVQGANPGLELNPGAPSSTIHYHAEELGNAQMAARIVEAEFGLPNEHLSPVQGYEPGQFDALRDHLNSADSRFVVIDEHYPHNPFVLSPSHLWPRSLLFLQVLETGQVVPMGYASVPESVPPGHTRDFWETVQEAAKTSQEKLVTEFRIQRLVAPQL